MSRLQKNLLLLALALAGALCRGETALEKNAALTPGMLARAAQFRAAIRTDGGVYRSGVYIYASRSVKDYAGAPGKLAARLGLLGLTDVYLTCESGKAAAIGDALEWRKTFIRSAHAAGMRVHAQTLERGSLFAGDGAVLEDCAAVLEYNKSAGPDERFDGVAADLEPHIMKRNAPGRPQNLALIWDSEKNSGVGKDNDLLLRRTTDVLALTRKTIGPLPLRQAVGFFFQTRFDAGEVANGDAGQFLQSCDALIVMAYNCKKERIWDMALPTLKAAAPGARCVSVCIKTSHGLKDGKPDPTSLQPRGWDAMVDAVKYIMSKGKSAPAFMGVDIYEFQGFEMMWSGRVTAQPR